MLVLNDISTISVIIFFIGMAFLIIEMFQPGFGVFGGLGLLCLVIDVIITAKTFAQALVMTGIIAALLVLMLTISIIMASKGYLPMKLILKDSTNAETGFSGVEDMQHLRGKVGTTLTSLRPSGNADFDGVLVDVVSRGDFIDSGTPVEVTEVEGNRIVVKRRSNSI